MTATKLFTWSCRGLSPDAATAAMVDGRYCVVKLSVVDNNTQCHRGRGKIHFLFYLFISGKQGIQLKAAPQ